MTEGRNETPSTGHKLAMPISEQWDGQTYYLDAKGEPVGHHESIVELNCYWRELAQAQARIGELEHELAQYQIKHTALMQEADRRYDEATAEAEQIAEMAKLQHAKDAKRIEELEEACLKSAAYNNFVKGGDVPSTVEAARIALVQRVEQQAERIRILESEEPGTPLGRIAGLARYAEQHCGYSPVGAKGPEQVIFEHLERQAARIGELERERAAVVETLGHDEDEFHEARTLAQTAQTFVDAHKRDTKKLVEQAATIRELEKDAMR